MTPRIPRFTALVAACGFLITATAGQTGRTPHRSVLLAKAVRNYPSPTNLKVLPRNLTGRQVNEIMEEWNWELGVRCEACHLRESEAVASAGPTSERFADDSKPMKQAARIMFSMTLEINRKFIIGDDGVPGPVTCGTCHRGDIRPQPFLSPSQAQRPSQETITSR